VAQSAARNYIFHKGAIMQELDGTMRILTEDEHDSLGFFNERKTVQIGQVFKVRRCYFEIVEVSNEGIKAKGISRKRYFDMKRGRPDWF